MRWLLAILLWTVHLTIAPDAPLERKPPKEWLCMAWVVWDEARGEPLKGGRAVLDVVLSRMDASGKTACEIIAEPKQFSGYTVPPYYVPLEAVARFAIVARMKPVAKGCSHFHATYVRPVWRHKMTQCLQVGRHVFYKEKKK